MKRFLISLFALALVLNLTSSPAFSAPGNNGTVKIVAEPGGPVEDRDNDPHVCRFHIYGFGFDANQSGEFTIVSIAPSNNSFGTAGGYKASATGEFSTRSFSLPDGHYKLTVSTPNGAGKHKVFWVDCGPNERDHTTPTPSPVPSVHPQGPTARPTNPVAPGTPNVPGVSPAPGNTTTPPADKGTPNLKDVKQLPSTSTN